MPIIDPVKLPQEIKDKYSVVNNSLRLVDIKNAELDKYKNEPKDEISVEIGDTKQTEFYPQAKISRWNEVNFSVRLKDTEYEKAQISYDKEKIIWDKDNIKIEYYDYPEGEGGYKMVWYLKSKPATNKVEFSLQSKGVRFTYQPSLTQKEIDEGCMRPENIVGSYTVYCSENKINWTDGKLYRTGKMGHIFRPKLIDSNGLEVWGDLFIDAEKGIYRVTIPEDFYNNAVYPIKANDIFGDNSTSGTPQAFGGGNDLFGALYTSTGIGTATKLTAYITDGGTSVKMKGCLYKNSDLGFVADSGSAEIDTTGIGYWQDYTMGDSPSITAIDYLLSIWGSGTWGIYYDSGTNTAYKDATSYNGFPATYSKDSTYSSRDHSIYATYTPAGGGPAIKSINGVAYASVKSVNGVINASIKSINGIT